MSQRKIGYNFTSIDKKYPVTLQKLIIYYDCILVIY